MNGIETCLWFDGKAEEAAQFYVSLFPNSRIKETSRYGEGSPMPAGTALMVTFDLDGRPFQALNGGPQNRFTPAVSFVISCRGQEEVDRYWDALVEGGEEGPCGWLTDRFGVSWQVVPDELGSLLGSADPAAAQRATAAMLQMSKLDVAALRAAHDGV